jgi:hypothetical protein
MAHIPVKRLLVEALSHHPYPETCPLVLLDWVLDLKRTSSVKSDVLNAFVVFLSLPRTSADLGQLFAGMQCRCDAGGPPSHAAAHRAGLVHFEHTSHAFPIHALLEAMTAQFFPVAEAVSRGMRDREPLQYRIDGPINPRRFYRRRALWPVTLAEMLPHGAEDSFRGLTAWLPYVPHSIGAGIFQYVKVLLLLQREDVLPYFTTSCTLRDAALDMLQVQYKAWTPEQSQACYEQMAKVISSVCEMIITWTHNTSMHEQAAFFRPRAAEYVAHCVKASELLFVLNIGTDARYFTATQRRLEAIYNVILNVAASVYAYVPECRAACLQQPGMDGAGADEALQRVLEIAGEHDPARVGQATLLTHMLVAHARRTRCAAPDCPTRTTVAAFQAATEREMLFCSGCTRMRYCSGACQKAAWRHSSLPHSAVCASFRMLRDELGVNKRGRADPALSDDNPVVHARMIALAALCGHLEALEDYDRQTSGMFTPRCIDKTLMIAR